MNTTSYLTIDTQNEKKFQKVFVKQGDLDSRSLSVSVTSGGSTFQVLEDMQPMMRCRMPDGTCLIQDCGVVSGRILVRIPARVMAVPGLTVADISIFDQAGTILSTMNFGIQVQKAPFTGERS